MKDVRPTSIELAKAIEDFLLHELDVPVTESDWFDEVIDKKVTEVINRKLTELGKGLKCIILIKLFTILIP